MVHLAADTERIGNGGLGKTQKRISLKDMIQSAALRKSRSKLSIAIGKDFLGKPVVMDLGKMPHLMIAGSAKSGKNRFVDSIICSILLKADPSEVKLILISPEKGDLLKYNGIPHLFMPVVETRMEAMKVLNWLLFELEERYLNLAEASVRDIKGYNRWIEVRRRKKGKSLIAKKKFLNSFELVRHHEKMPYLLVIISELANLMQTWPKEVEDRIIRLVQLSRAVGIHLVLGSEKPNVNVVTGTIKANFFAKICFKVESETESRVILDTGDAKHLRGGGDMLFIFPGRWEGSRIQGIMPARAEVKRVIDQVQKE